MSVYYYHYKHNPSDGINSYAYEFLGIGYHTETNEEFVIYKPLYTTQDGRQLFLRPRTMFFENILDGRPRFQRITDENVIRELEVIKAELENI